MRRDCACADGRSEKAKTAAAAPSRAERGTSCMVGSGVGEAGHCARLPQVMGAKARVRRARADA